MSNIANVLIVDDNETNRNLLNKMILALGHIPVPANNGLSALTQLNEKPIDIVLLDILMPEMDGYEVLGRIKSHPGLSDIPVIMISAVDDIDSVVRCIGQGAVDYLVKPFNATLLETRIESCLENKRLRDREKQMYAELTELHEELKINYETLRKAEQARDAMSHMIIHDLRSPLTTIQGFIQIMQHRRDEKTIIDYIPRILGATKNMAMLIKSILDISRLEAEKMPVSLVSLNILELINDVYEPFIPQADKEGIQLSVEPESRDIVVAADKELMSRILQNLINNGLKHTKDYVKISVTPQDDSIIISVTDNGPGIPEKYKVKIFDKYFRIEAGKDRKKYGVGLGLAFCKMAIEAQKGSIYVESEEGKGSSFNVKLNIVKAD
ncbi:MAG: hybrid sensor histidine kinase/response regulator [Candidatus Anammoxibacter sp.]